MKQILLTVHGKVQGVGFRYFSQMKAVQFNIKGWVRNCNDGTVEIFAQGLPDNLNRFIDEIKRGNPFSKVDDVIMKEEIKSEIYHSFMIKY